MDIGNTLALVIGAGLLYFAIRGSQKREADSKPVEPIKPIETIEEEPQTTFTKEELAQAIEKGITEAKKKNTDSFGVKMMKGGCAIMVFQFAVVWLIVIAIIFYVLFSF